MEHNKGARGALIDVLCSLPFPLMSNPERAAAILERLTECGLTVVSDPIEYNVPADFPVFKSRDGLIYVLPLTPVTHSGDMVILSVESLGKATLPVSDYMLGSKVSTIREHVTETPYADRTSDQRTWHLVEEVGELLASIGKAGRWGLEGYNPELPPEKRETNREWIKRELADVRARLDAFEQDLL